jgi:hypothetical protein
MLDPKAKENIQQQDAMMPFSRWELLKDTLHYRFWELVAVSLFTFVFWIPVFAWLIFCSLGGFLDFSSLASVGLTYGIAAVFLVVASLGMAGAFFFAKKLVWSEGASLPGDFFEGIRKNGKAFAAIYLALGLLYAVLRLDICALQYSGAVTGWVLPVGEGLSYAAFFLFLLALFFAQTETIIYAGSPFRLFWNGIRLSLGGLLTNIPVFLAFFACFLIFDFVPFYQASFACLAIEALFYFGFSTVFFTEYSYFLFDKSINLKQYPEILRKGLRKEGGAHENPSDPV